RWWCVLAKGAFSCPFRGPRVGWAAAGHRVPGVDGQVDDDLLHLRGVGADAAEVAAAAGDELHVFADEALEERAHALDDLAEVQDARLQDLLAAEGQELVGQGGRARPREAEPQEGAA